MERLAKGVDILRTYARSTLAPTYAAQEVVMASDGSVQLVIGESGITLMFGKGAIEQKLLMAARVMGKVRARGEAPTLVFLDNEAHPERVVVRLH
jgi:cell division protein FtsQ